MKVFRIILIIILSLLVGGSAVAFGVTLNEKNGWFDSIVNKVTDNENEISIKNLYLQQSLDDEKVTRAVALCDYTTEDIPEIEYIQYYFVDLEASEYILIDDVTNIYGQINSGDDVLSAEDMGGKFFICTTPIVLNEGSYRVNFTIKEKNKTNEVSIYRDFEINELGDLVQ